MTHYETTVVISTQHIEEAISADTVGILKDGRLIIESGPDDLLSNYKTDSLQDAFIKICLEHRFPERNTSDQVISFETSVCNTFNISLG